MKKIEVKEEDYLEALIKKQERAYEIAKMKEQQEEFIKYLEDEIKFYKNRDIYMIVDMFGSYDLNDIKLKLLEEILSKYKEITGLSDENTIK